VGDSPGRALTTQVMELLRLTGLDWGPWALAMAPRSYALSSAPRAFATQGPDPGQVQTKPLRARKRCVEHEGTACCTETCISGQERRVPGAVCEFPLATLALLAQSLALFVLLQTGLGEAWSGWRQRQSPLSQDFGASWRRCLTC
jgi:hypothetical protein